MGEIRRPAPLRNASLQELTRVVKHDQDNIERTHRRLKVLELTDAVHGVEQIVDPQWATLPQCIPGGVATTQRIANVAMRLIQPELSERSQLGVTVYYAPPFGEISLLRSTAQSIAYNDLDEPVSWESALYEAGALSYSTTTITCTEAGIIQAQYSSLFNTAAGGWRQWWINHNGAVRADSLIPGGSYAAACGNDEIVVAAGDTLKLQVYQNQTAAVALDLTASRTRMQVRYVAPAPSTTDDVTLLLICD